MSIVGISGTRDTCPAEGEINLSVVDSNGKDEVDPILHVGPHDQIEAAKQVKEASTTANDPTKTLAELLAATGHNESKTVDTSQEQRRIARTQNLQRERQAAKKGSARRRPNFTIDGRKARSGQSAIEAAAAIRPLRLAVVGKAISLSNADLKFLVLARDHNFKCKFQQRNPKKQGSQSFQIYEKFKAATTLQESIDVGSSWARIKDDYRKGFIQFPGRESKQPGHVFAGSCQGEPHILDILGLNFDHVSEEAALLADTFQSYGEGKIVDIITATMDNRFHEVIKGVYEKHLIIDIWDELTFKNKLIEDSGTRLMANSGRVNYTNINHDLDPEPEYKSSLQESGCLEWFEWEQARAEELRAMQKFGVYRIVHRSEAQGKRLLTSKWVHKRKTNKFGEISRYKARLVARGFAQLPYENFNPDEIFAHVVDRNSLRALLALSAGRNLKVYSADVSSAFLQAPLSEKIYMEAPPGVNIPKDHVFVLDKAIYGCKQSARAWSDELDSHLEKIGFSRTTADPCLWTRNRNGKEWYVATYVDDLTICCTDDDARDILMKELRQKFEMKDEEGEPIDYLLEIHIKQDLEAGTIQMSQELSATKLANSFLTEQERSDACRVLSPMCHSVELPKLAEREVPDTEFHYLSAIGSLLYLSACTRPDIAAATGVLSRHSLAPGKAHVSAVKRLIQYVYNTRSYGLEYRRDDKNSGVPVIFEQGRHPVNKGDDHMEVFVDSDYAADSSRRSTQGIVAMMNGGPISWSSVLGKTICTSTAEAEVTAAVSATKEALHLKLLLHELGAKQDVIHIWEDNTACIAQGTGGLRHIRKAKHYSIGIRFLQQAVLQGDVALHHINTNLQLADMFTKPLDPEKFTYFRDQMMVNINAE